MQVCAAGSYISPWNSRTSVLSHSRIRLSRLKIVRMSDEFINMDCSAGKTRRVAAMSRHVAFHGGPEIMCLYILSSKQGRGKGASWSNVLRNACGKGYKEFNEGRQLKACRKGSTFLQNPLSLMSGQGGWHSSGFVRSGFQAQETGRDGSTCFQPEFMMACNELCGRGRRTASTSLGRVTQEPFCVQKQAV